MLIPATPFIQLIQLICLFLLDTIGHYISGEWNVGLWQNIYAPICNRLTCAITSSTFSALYTNILYATMYERKAARCRLFGVFLTSVNYTTLLSGT